MRKVILSIFFLYYYFRLITSISTTEILSKYIFHLAPITVCTRLTIKRPFFVVIPIKL
jgi:hypothetical protein